MSQDRLGRCLDLLDEVSVVLIDDEDDELYDLVDDHLTEARGLIRNRLGCVQRLLWHQWKRRQLRLLTDG